MITTTENDIKERLSWGFLTAVAARAGCQVISWSIDKLSVDASVRAVSGLKSIVEFQLKATGTNIIQDGSVFFDLPTKNYRDLTPVPRTHPHYLLVLHLPGLAANWLTLTPDQLVMSGCAYYFNLVGLPPLDPPDVEQKRVKAPITQRFTQDVLKDMLLVAPQRIGGPGA